MTEIPLIWILTAGFFILDLLVIAIHTSLSFASLPHLLNLRETREKSIDRTVRVIEDPRLRTSLRLAVLFIHFIFAGLLTAGWFRVIPDLRTILFLLYLLIGLLVLSLAEFLVESVVLENPEAYAIRFRHLGAGINFLFTPLSIIMMAVLGSNVNKVSLASLTDEDLKNWVEVGQAEGTLEKGEREMIYSIFHFGDTLAKEIMVPRIDVQALDIKDTLGEARETFVQAGHSRVPVYEDTVDNVVGLLYAKDLLSISTDEDQIAQHRDMLRLVYFVPETKKVDELLAEMQARSMHMAIVVDEYGGVAGVVTLEDIVEEIVGEIRDEYDSGEEMPYSQISDHEFVFQGRVDLDIFNEVMQTDISTDNADTIGGYIYGEIGDVPTGGESLHAEGVTLIVDEVEGRRITKVRAKHDDLSAPQEEKENDG